MNKVSYTATPGGTCKLVVEADSPAEFDRLIRDFHDGFIPLSDNRTEVFFVKGKNLDVISTMTQE